MSLDIRRLFRFYRKMTAHAIARKLAGVLPPKVIYWATLRALSYATSGKYGSTSPNLPAMEMLHRYSRDHKVNT